MFTDIKALKERSPDRQHLEDGLRDAFAAAARQGVHRVRVQLVYSRVYPNGQEDGPSPATPIDQPADGVDPVQIADRVIELLERTVGNGFRGHVRITCVDADAADAGNGATPPLAGPFDRYVQVGGAGAGAAGMPPGYGWPGMPMGGPGGMPWMPGMPGMPPGLMGAPNPWGFGYGPMGPMGPMGGPAMPPFYGSPGYGPPGYGGSGYPPGGFQDPGGDLGEADEATRSLSAAMLSANERRLDGEREHSRAMANALLQQVGVNTQALQYGLALNALVLNRGLENLQPSQGDGLWGVLGQILMGLLPPTLRAVIPQAGPPPAMAGPQQIPAGKEAWVQPPPPPPMDGSADVGGGGAAGDFIPRFPDAAGGGLPVPAGSSGGPATRR